MKIILAADHRGFELKEKIKQYLADLLIKDCGAMAFDENDDYVDYAQAAIENIKEEDRGILCCGSGHGMDMVANRYPHIRAILGFNVAVVKQGREHEDANVLVLPSDWVKEEEAKIMIDTFLNTPFNQEERHIRRINKLK